MGRKKKSEDISPLENLQTEDILVDGNFYKGNENLLRGNAQIKWNEEMIDEIKNCAKKVLHFAENYFYITTLDDGKQKIKLYKFQKNLLKGFANSRFTICSASRQVGKCLQKNTLCKIKNKKTGEIEEITIQEFYNRFSKKTNQKRLAIRMNIIVMKNKEKIIETYDVSNYEILTDTGWEDVTHVHKTIPFDIWRLELDNGMFIDCADEHIVINELGEQIYVQNLNINDGIKTSEGIKKVTKVVKTDAPAENMYDITVGSNNHTFYSNGILSHNTTVITVYALWIVCFQADKRITIVANKEDTAKEIFSRIKMAFEQLPVWMKPSVKSWRKDGFVLSNDSAITISTTSSSGPRGSTSNLLIIDEMAHCPADLMRELWKSAIPIISSSKKSQIIVISTPNGMDNKFYELYEDAKKPNSDWNLEVVYWYDVPGRDEQWKNDTIASMGSKEDFKQEFENYFHDKNKTAIDSEELERLKAQSKDPILVMDNGDYKIFSQPKEGSFYVIGADVGEGIGRTNSVCQILDVSDLTEIEQVAVYASNSISPYNFGTRIMGILEDWGRPPILIENNNNGVEVLNVLSKTHNYENIVTYNFEGMSKHYNNENRLGIHNHTNTRYKGITNFRYWINSLKALYINDIDTILEISNFVRLPNFTFTKRSDKDLDDRVLSLVWALFILDPSLATKYFNITELDEQGRPLKIRPLIDSSELIKKSPIFQGKVSVYKKSAIASTPIAWVGKIGENDNPEIDKDAAEFALWLTGWDGKTPPPNDLSISKPLRPDEPDNYSSDGYMPTMFF